ncbi:MAG: FmdB family zinc ribbon protein [Spirochaetota bacterium]
MPTYEYKCTSCGHTFDLFQPITADTVSKCAQCGAPAQRLISGGTGIIFKGSGFYVNDYKNKKPSSDAKPCSPEACKTCPAAAEKK